MSSRLDVLARRSIPVLGLLLLLLLGASSPGLAYEQQIAAEAAALAEAAAAAEARTLAVVDFTDLQGKNKLSATGLIDPKTARELGRIAGVQGLITGTVTPLGESVRLSIKVLDTETAQIVTSTATDIPKTDAISELLRKGIWSGSSGRGPSPTSKTAGGSAEFTTEAGQFIFKLRNCLISAEKLKCSMTVTNAAAKDRHIQLKTDSRFIDRHGEEYFSSRVRVGNSEDTHWATATLVRQIPMVAEITFNKVPQHVLEIAVLELSFGDGYSFGKAQLRNIPIHRKQ